MNGRAAGRELAAFFTLAFGWSWLCWGAAAFRGHGPASVSVLPLLYAGIAGPLLATVLLLVWRGGAGEGRALWRSLYQVERLAPRWLLAVLLLYPALSGLAVAADVLAGGVWPAHARLAALLQQPSSFASYLGLLLLLGPLPEEPGWRGFALPRLCIRRGPLAAALWLGLLWALWHLPLFWVPGTYQQRLGVGGAAFWQYLFTALAASVLIAWLWWHTGRSLLAAVLFHASLNLSRDLLPLGERAELIRSVLLLLVTLAVARRGFTAPPGADQPRASSATR